MQDNFRYDILTGKTTTCTTTIVGIDNLWILEDDINKKIITESIRILMVPWNLVVCIVLQTEYS